MSGLRWKAIWGQYLVQGVSNIKTLLKFDNGTGATSEVDVIDEAGRTWTRNSSTVTVSTTQKKYGVSSLYTPVQHYVSAEYSEDFYFANGDFCIELWVYHVDYTKCYAFQWGDMSSYGYRLTTRPCYGLLFEVVWNDGGESFTLNYDDSSIQAIQPTTWFHVAVARYGSAITLYLNGVAVATDVAVTMPDAISCVNPNAWKFYVTKMEAF